MPRRLGLRRKSSDAVALVLPPEAEAEPSKSRKERAERQEREASSETAGQEEAYETRPEIAAHPRVRSYVAKAVRDEVQNVEQAKPEKEGGNGRNNTLNDAALKLGHYVRDGGLKPKDITEKLRAAAIVNKLVKDTSEKAVRATIASGLRKGMAEPTDLSWLCAEATATADDFTDDDMDAVIAGLCLTLRQWRERKLPPRDYLMGAWLTTTSRVMLVAPTGLGKTNLGLAIAIAVASGQGILHWKGHRCAKVLYVDGEMSRELFQERLEDAQRRSGVDLDTTLFGLCKDDIERMPPLNTEAGQHFVDKVIEQRIGSVDLIIFDNIMSLLPGEQKDEESWRLTVPWIQSLTKRRIGQIWVHHTGHKEDHSYGTKTREWLLDAVILMTRLTDANVDIAFTLEFTKARGRKPDNRDDFDPVKVRLANDKWRFDLVAGKPRKEKARLEPKEEKALDVLLDVVKAHGVARPQSGGECSVTTQQWMDECFRVGMLDIKKEQKNERSRFSNWRTGLVAKGRITCEGDFSWPLVIVAKPGFATASAEDFDDEAEAE
jgi:hypothetical protein